MKFEVVNDKGVAMMSCTNINLIPDEKQLLSIAEAKYKFKLNGKYITRKKLKEFIGGDSNVN